MSETMSYMLRNAPEIGYLHLLPGLHSRLLVATVFGFIGVQFVMFCAMDWSSGSLAGLGGTYEKIVGVLFQCVNTRHTGETVVDLSALTPAVLVLLVVMMLVSLIPFSLATLDFSDQEAVNGEGYMGVGFWELWDYVVGKLN